MVTSHTIRLHPENPSEIDTWARKWGVSRQTLYEAILSTGCLDAHALREYVRRDKWYYHPVRSAVKLVKAGVNLIF